MNGPHPRPLGPPHPRPLSLGGERGEGPPTARTGEARPRVIVHADDFGLHPAINAGVARAHREGVVSSASVMPTGAAFEEAARLAGALPSLDLGLHFALAGAPGFPSTLGQFVRAYARGQFPARIVAEALRRQIRDARRGLPVPLSHIDSHQHLHALPPIMRVVCAVAREQDIPAVRLPQDGPALAAVSPARRAQAAALRAAARLSRRYVAASGLRTTDHFSGMAVSGHLTAPTLAAYLRDARPGTTEVVCHAGADNRALSQTFDWGYDWEGETAAACALEVQAAARTVEIVGWRELG